MVTVAPCYPVTPTVYKISGIHVQTVNNLGMVIHHVMSETDLLIPDAERGDQLLIKSPEVGKVTVLLPEPRKRTTLQDGRHHFVFVRPSGRMVGMNVPGDIDVERSLLVEDEDGFQHAIVAGFNGEAALYTRRPPGQPDDWEQRDTIEPSAITKAET